MLKKLVDQQILILAEDSHFDKLKKASAELTKRLQKSKAKTLAFVFVAIDSKISANSPEIIEVQEIVTKGWTTFASAARDSAVAYIRAVILESLENLSQDENYASLIFLAAKNLIQYKTLIASEKQIVSEFLTEIGNRLTDKANTQWGMNLTPDLAGFKSQITYTTIDRAKLEASLKAASASTDDGGENPVTIASDTWPNAFSKRSATGIADEVAKIVKSAANEIVNNQIALLKYFDSIVKSQDIRSKLIWWKESGYSDKLRKPYRDLGAGVLEVCMAEDFASFMPINCPASAKYFLLNAYKSYIETPTFADEITFSEFLSKISQDKSKLIQVLPNNDVLGTRISLIQFLNGLVEEKFKTSQFEALIGIKADKKVRVIDLMIWLFEDNQVEKILNV